MYEEQGTSKFRLIYETKGPKFNSSREPPKLNGPAFPVSLFGIPNLIDLISLYDEHNPKL